MKSSPDDACLDADLDLFCLESGTISVESRRSLGTHVLHCIRCQIVLTVFVADWETKHYLPTPPQSIERWRAVAAHLRTPGDNEDDGDAGYTPHPDERAFWWRHELAELEKKALQTGWSLDGEQDARLQQWLEQIEAVAQACGGLSPKRTRPGSSERRPERKRAPTYARR